MSGWIKWYCPNSGLSGFKNGRFCTFLPILEMEVGMCYYYLGCTLMMYGRERGLVFLPPNLNKHFSVTDTWDVVDIDLSISMTVTEVGAFITPPPTQFCRPIPTTTGKCFASCLFGMKIHFCCNLHSYRLEQNFFVWAQVKSFATLINLTNTVLL